MKKIKLTKNMIILAYNDALKDQIFQNLRGITIDWNDNEINSIMYINGEINDEVIETIDSIDTYFLGHMSDGIKSNYKIIRCDFPFKMPGLKEWIYLKDKNNKRELSGTK